MAGDPRAVSKMWVVKGPAMADVKWDTGWEAEEFAAFQ